MSPKVETSTPLPAPAAERVAVPFKDSIWRPVLSCGGALVIGAALAPLVIQPPQREEPKPEKRITLRGSQIAVAQAAKIQERKLLQGSLTVLADQSAVSPVAGLVARHLAEPGTSVKRGQAVMEISVGAAVRPVPVAEIKQTAAEKRQINAVDEQNQLADRISKVRERLEIADARVRKAEERVAAARDLLKQVQAGDSPAREPVEAPVAVATAAPAKVTAATFAAADKAQQEVKQAEKALNAAQAKVLQAERDARNAAEAWKKATANIDKVEAQFESGNASGADVETARSAAMEAQEKATAANNATFAAKQDVQRHVKRFAAAREVAAKAEAKVAADLKAVQVFETPQKPEPVAVAESGPTLQEAAREVKAALDESRAASREAEILHARIDSYENQVRKSQGRVESAAKALQAAQQQVLDTMPRPKFVSVAAPNDGIIAWVAPLAREVGPGQSVFGLSRGKLTAAFEDKSGLWRNLQIGATLPALIPAEPAPGAVPAATPAAATAATQGTLVTLTVTAVNKPAAEGQPARVLTNVKLDSPATPAQTLRPGMKLLASLSQEPAGATTLQIPASSVFDYNWQRYVAVLETPSLADTASQEFDVVWKPVKIGGSKDGRVMVVDGLEAGDRVVRTPEMLPKPDQDLSDLIAVVQS